jgi:hypothetical protein
VLFTNEEETEFAVRNHNQRLLQPGHGSNLLESVSGKDKEAVQ